MAHKNSLLAYQDLDKKTRKNNILNIYKEKAQPLTDRAVAIYLKQEDLNYVRPRITELIQEGHLIEVGATIDPKTRRTVRMVRFPVDDKQFEWSMGIDK